MKHELISNININFDSLGWALQLNPREFDDPTFFTIADRFLKLADKYDFKYTIFVIGKDLENPAVAKIVKEWQNLGHEIGNHSYNHKTNFGSLSYDAINYEVMKSHLLIKSACKKDPKGFIAPGWATSRNLIRILIENQYKYDTSLFPSWFMYLAQLKFLWNFKNDKRRFEIFKRSDYSANLFGDSIPFYTDGNSLYYSENYGRLLILPLPVSKYLKIPCWHTMKFILPSRVFNRSLHYFLKSNYFYYLVHPTDLMDLNDVPKLYKEKVQVLERIKVPLHVKNNMMEKVLSKIKKQSSRMVTLSEISDDIYQNRQGIN
jgi:peptidoglycan/xylan/chitin deacetylase (PgdA/CDA1 family)